MSQKTIEDLSQVFTFEPSDFIFLRRPGDPPGDRDKKISASTFIMPGGSTAGNISPDPTGGKGDDGWTTTDATVTTETTTLTGFATELKILGTGSGTAIWTIPVPAQLRGQELELRYEGYLNVGAPIIAVLDASDNVLPFSGSIPSALGKFESIGRFYTNDSATVKIRITVANLDDLRMTNIYLGRRQVVYGAAIGPWTPYTPTFQGFGTPTGVNCRWRQNGENAELDLNFTPGTSTSAEARVGLPISLTSIAGMPATKLCGDVVVDAVSSQVRRALIEPSVGYITFSAFNPDDNPTNGQLTKRLGTEVANSGQRVSVIASIPISQFQGSGVVQLAENSGTLYLSNTESVANTNGVVGKSYYGIEGAPIVSNTAATYYDITLPRALQPDEVPVLEVRSKVDGNWVPVETAGVRSLWIGSFVNGFQSGSNWMARGLKLTKTTSSQIRVEFPSVLPGGSSAWENTAATDRAWSAITAAADGYDRWRVRIDKAGARQETPTVRADVWLNTTSALGNNAIIPYNSVLVDTHGCITLGAGFRFTCKVPGQYTIKGSAYQTTTATRYYVFKNGVQVTLCAYSITTMHSTVIADVEMSVGDYIDIRMETGGSVPGSARTTANNWLQITRIGA